MTNTFKKKVFRGFTLIELLVVIAIIGLLSTVIAAPITQARKKGRDGKKVADMRQIVSALQQYADDNAGKYPNDIANLVPQYLANLPVNAASSTLQKDKYMYVPYVDATAGNVGFHVGVKLEATNQALGDDRDCTGIGAAATNCISSTVFYGASSVGAGNFGSTGFATNGASAPTSGTDFDGGSTNPDIISTNCTSAIVAAAAACVYDLTN